MAKPCGSVALQFAQGAAAQAVDQEAAAQVAAQGPRYPVEVEDDFVEDDYVEDD